VDDGREPAPLANVLGDAPFASQEVTEPQLETGAELELTQPGILGGADFDSHEQVPNPDELAEPERERASERGQEPTPLGNPLEGPLFGSQEVPEPDQPAEPQPEKAAEPEGEPEPAPPPDLLASATEEAEKAAGDLGPPPNVLGGEEEPERVANDLQPLTYGLGGGGKEPERGVGDVPPEDGATALDDEVARVPNLPGESSAEPAPVPNVVGDALFGTPDPSEAEAGGDVEHEAEPESVDALYAAEPPLQNVVDRQLGTQPDDVQVDTEPAPKAEVDRAVFSGALDGPVPGVLPATLVGDEPEPEQEDAPVTDGLEDTLVGTDEDELVRNALDAGDDMERDVDEIAEQLASDAEVPDKVADDGAGGGGGGTPVLSDMVHAALTEGLEDDNRDLIALSDHGDLIDQES
jgi:hypothetical protein